MKPVVILVFALCVVLNGSSTSLSRGQESRDEARAGDSVDVELRVQRLIQQLEHSQREQRDAAEQGLIDLGEAALSYLPEVNLNTSAETKERLTRIRSALDQALLANVMQPSHVTLDGKYRLAEILQQIQQQTGNQLVDFRQRFGQQPSDAQLSVEYQNMEFWPAIDQLLDQAKLTTYSYTGEPRTLGIVAANQNTVARFGSAELCGCVSHRTDGNPIATQFAHSGRWGLAQYVWKSCGNPV